MRICFGLMLLFTITSSAFAQEEVRSNRLSLGGLDSATSGYFYNKKLIYSRNNASASFNDLNLRISYSKRISDSFDLTIRPLISYSHSGSGPKYYSIGADIGSTINFGANYNEAFTLFGGIGVYSSKVTGDLSNSRENDTNINYIVEFGKRFSLKNMLGSDQLTYSPSISYTYFDAGKFYRYSSATIGINLIQFDFIF